MGQCTTHFNTSVNNPAITQVLQDALKNLDAKAELYNIDITNLTQDDIDALLGDIEYIQELLKIAEFNAPDNVDDTFGPQTALSILEFASGNIPEFADPTGEYKAAYALSTAMVLAQGSPDQQAAFMRINGNLTANLVCQERAKTETLQTELNDTKRKLADEEAAHTQTRGELSGTIGHLRRAEKTIEKYEEHMNESGVRDPATGQLINADGTPVPEEEPAPIDIAPKEQPPEPQQPNASPPPAPG